MPDRARKLFSRAPTRELIKRELKSMLEHTSSIFELQNDRALEPTRNVPFLVFPIRKLADSTQAAISCSFLPHFLCSFLPHKQYVWKTSYLRHREPFCSNIFCKKIAFFETNLTIYFFTAKLLMQSY